MSRPDLIAYIKAFYGLYQNVNSKPEKSALLNQAVKITGKSKRQVFRYLTPDTDGLKPRVQGRGREVVYDYEALLPHVRRIWKAMEFVSPERMKAALPKWLHHYTDPKFSPELKSQLLQMSASTIARLLSPIREENKTKKGIPTTSSGLRTFLNRVPINTLDHKVVKPGYTQADTVAHCGTTTAGQYLNSITITDLWSGWTDNRALKGKKALEVRKAIIDIKIKLPFELLAVNTDSGSEFINQEVFNLLNPHPVFSAKNRIQFTRSRPYKKNDNCYVEQRNYTHVRQLFGYYRLEELGLVDLMNEIYEQYWNPLHNYFLPSQKLVAKERVGSKIVKTHDTPKTPADRLLESAYLSDTQKAKLRNQAESLNPFELASDLERRLKDFFELHKKTTVSKEAA